MFKINKNQGGMAHVMIIAVVVILAGVGGVGYYVMNKNKDKSSSSNNSPAQIASNKEVQDACNTALKDKDFCKFASNFSAVGSYKLTLTSTTDGKPTVINSEVENTNNFSSTTTQDGKELSAYISIGNDSYVKDESDGKWIKSTYTNPDAKSSNTPDFKDSVKATDFSPAELAKTEYKKIGKEACDNLTCFKYQITEKDNPNSQNFIWFDTHDYLMRKMTFVSDGNTTEMKLSYPKISIKAPTPIKEAPSDSSVQDQVDAAIQAAQDNQQ